MPRIIPFKGILPSQDLAINLINGLEFYSFAIISEQFQDYLHLGKIQEELRPILYIYRLENSERAFTGFWTTTSSEDLINGEIRKHEKIRPERCLGVQEMFKKKGIDFNPILLTYIPVQQIDEWIEKETQATPYLSLYEKQSKITHTIWKVSEAMKIEDFQNAFSKIGPVYLADGHHRAEAFQNWILEKEKGGIPRKSLPGFSSIYFPLSEVEIKAYHRVVKLFNPNLLDQIMERIRHFFTLLPFEKLEFPKKKGDFFLINSRKEIYKMNLKPEFILKIHSSEKEKSGKEILKFLDVTIIQDFIFNACLNIDSMEALGVLDYIGGIDQETLVYQVFSGQFTFGFILSPPEFMEIQVISDLGLFMPPKSTYFEPKIPSGLIIQKLN